MPEVIPYRANNGRNYFEEWLETLDKVTLAKVLQHVRKLNVGLGLLKPLGGKLWELKIDLGPGYRVYFYRKGNETVILLAASAKIDQDRTIALARKLIKEMENE